MNLRDARSTDAGKLGAIMEKFCAANPWMPDLWTGAEHIAHAGAMIDRGWVRLVCDDSGAILGFIARQGGDVISLYVDNDKRGHGVGKALLDEAKEQQDRLVLWAHVANRGARRFYRRMGFEETGHRTGADTDEGLPAVRYEWRRKSAGARVRTGTPGPSKGPPGSDLAAPVTSAPTGDPTGAGAERTVQGDKGTDTA